MSLSTLGHLPGRNISAGTYNAGCRCDACRHEARIYRNNRYKSGHDAAKRSYSDASVAAAAWVRQNRPDVWNQLLVAARLGGEA
jgi:hypothetical protein